VQLGAFKDQNNADSLANALRTGGFPVEVAQITRGSGDGRGAPQQHELFVAEAGAARVNAALKGRGSAQPVPGGVTVKPAFDLEEAMSISKRLTDQGLKVVIRPAGGATFGSGGATLHVVRAGGYPDRSRAVAARDELSAKGHGAGIVTQGSAK
jgi:cell division septation protein DedD